MTTNFSINLDKFFKNIFIKKQYLQKLKKQALLINTIKQHNYKLVNQKLFKTKSIHSINDSIMYIIDLMVSKSNTFLHVMDSTGKLKFFCSAGHLQYKGKNKKFRFTVLKSIYRILITKLHFLRNKPIALHLKNVGFNRFLIIKKLKKKFFIKTVKIFNLFPFNGCRKKKIRRTKIKRKP
jgi:ribosomal protein S11